MAFDGNVPVATGHELGPAAWRYSPGSAAPQLFFYFFRTFGVRAKLRMPLSLAREVQPCWAEFLSDLGLGGSMESAFLSSTPCCCIRSRLFKRDHFMRRAMVVFLVTVYRRFDAVTSADHGGGSGSSPSRAYVVGSNTTMRRARSTTCAACAISNKSKMSLATFAVCDCPRPWRSSASTI